MEEEQVGRVSNLRLFRQIMDRDDMTGPERWVAIALAYHRNERNHDCFPSQRLISRKTGMSQRKVGHIVDSLRRKRILETRAFDENGHGGIQRRIRYYFLLDHKMGEPDDSESAQ